MSTPQRIVVIDDNANDVQVTRRFLERRGFVVAAATSGAEGLAIARTITPDAFVDYTSAGGIKGQFPEIKAWLSQVLPHFPAYQHLVTNKDIRIEQTLMQGMNYLALNTNDPILSNPKVREAIRYLIDYDGLANTILGHQLKRYGEAEPDNVSIRMDGNSLIEDLQEQVRSLEPDRVTPVPDRSLTVMTSAPPSPTSTGR